MNISLGEKVRMKREEMGISQEELAARMGYRSRSSINKIEMGRPISQKIIVRLSKALNVPISYLMDWEEDSISSAANEMNDKNTYSDQVEADLKNFYLEIGELSLTPSEIRMIQEYAKTVKENSSNELHKAFIILFEKLYSLDLSIEELNDLYTYAQFIRSKRKDD